MVVPVDRGKELNADGLLKGKNRSEAVILGDRGVERIWGSSSLLPTTVWAVGAGKDSLLWPLLLYPEM